MIIVKTIVCAISIILGFALVYAGLFGLGWVTQMVVPVSWMKAIGSGTSPLDSAQVLMVVWTFIIGSLGIGYQMAK
jgi:hypothetical protein